MANPAQKSSWEFSQVLLTLDNVLLPEDKLSPTPSMKDGLESETETDLRILGCELIQTAGILLKLPQVAMATGQVLFQRFYYCKSFVNHNMDVVAMASINLAAKIEESPRRIRDVINVFHHMKQIRLHRLLTPLVLDEHYVKMKNDVIKAERRLLKELGFCVHVQHPHKLIIMYLKVLKLQDHNKLVQRAWNYMNDSFRTNVFVRYSPQTIAAACIYLSARQLQVPLPNKEPAWYSLIHNTTLPAIRDVCKEILRLYNRAKPDIDKLEQTVSKLKKAQLEAKAKLRGNLGGGTPNPGINNSRPGTPSKASPYSNTTAATTEDMKAIGDSQINGLKNKLKERNRSVSRSQSRSPSRKHSRSMPKRYRDRSRSRSRHRHDHKSKAKSRKRSRTRSRSRSPDRSGKRYRSRSRSRGHHRTSSHKSSRSHSRDRYRR